ncbi:MAG: hypothetical protein PHU71_05345 [Candidatus Gracilibacteria bacterium]|nr:hypothetical protein [Candidatus Gracilibacteria bacterium]
MTAEEAFLGKYRPLIPAQNWQDFLDHYKKPLRKSIRINTSKVSVENFKKLVPWTLDPIPWCQEGFFVDREDRSIPLGSTWQHIAGLFYIQEAASMLPVSKISLNSKTRGHAPLSKSSFKILDLCSAPGSKTTQLANRFPNSLIVANEVDRKRAIALKQNLTRQGVMNVVILSVDAAKLAYYLPNFFDLVLVDAPCSGEGMIRKNPKVLEFWDEKKIEYMAGIQKRISKEALKTLKPGGELIYSTCTYAPEENEEVLAELEANITDIQRIWPQDFDTGGFFAARVVKELQNQDVRPSPPAPKGAFGQAPHYSHPQRLKKDEDEFLGKKQVLFIQNKLQKYWDIDLAPYLEDYVVMQSEQELRLIPKAATSKQLQPLVSKSIQVGIELGSLIRDEFILSHQAAVALGQNASKNVLELSDKAAGLACPESVLTDRREPAQALQTFLSGRDLQIEKSPQETKQLIVKYQGFPLGIVKIVGEKLKNQLPRDFRINNGHLTIDNGQGKRILKSKVTCQRSHV